MIDVIKCTSDISLTELNCECEGAKDCPICNEKGSVTVLDFSEASLYWHEMLENFVYRLEADYQYSNFVTDIYRIQDKLFVTYLGGEFKESQSFWFDIQFLNTLELNLNDPLQLETVTLDGIHDWSTEVYNTIMSADYKGTLAGSGILDCNEKEEKNTEIYIDLSTQVIISVKMFQDLIQEVTPYMGPTAVERAAADFQLWTNTPYSEYVRRSEAGEDAHDILGEDFAGSTLYFETAVIEPSPNTDEKEYLVIKE
ncbi:hypothetical protein [Paenibacillus sp. MER 78]|uniref:hypothetical protein n=1 Tax=Paenibacillus sp. MER 78 TaxID=2939571 RepID=UPI00203F4B60|nr:hypothetical protein [Paenibacillus sp. MER 78]MCM3130544.1 hypothetical protein [Paenibacillus sp. MER 78]